MNDEHSTIWTINTLSIIMKVSPDDPKIAKVTENSMDERKSHIRYVVLILTALCLSSIMSNIVCFNFTVLCMPGIGEKDALTGNKTEYIGYTQRQKTMLFSSVAIGALSGVFPIALGITHYGCKMIFFSSGMITSVATALIPLVAHTDMHMFLFLRFLQGLAFANCFPIVGAVTSRWASLTQQGLFIAALTSFGQVSSVFSMPVAGELCTTEHGWKTVFYLHSVISAVLFGLWFAFFTDLPESNKLVHQSEIDEIQDGKSSDQSSKDAHKSIPYLEILTTPSIWGVWVGAFGDLVAVQLIHIYSPMYLHLIGGYSVEKTGFAAAVPVLFQFIVKLTAGHSSDQIKFISETFKLRMYNSLALGASAIFLIALGFVQKGHGIIGLILLTLATSMFGFNGGGFNKCAALVSRQYTHFVMANIQFILCLSMLACPILVSFMLGSGSISEWRMVFIVHAALLLFCNLFFCIFATAKPAPWTDRTIKKSRSKNTPIYTINQV